MSRVCGESLQRPTAGVVRQKRKVRAAGTIRAAATATAFHGKALGLVGDSVIPVSSN
jgi:hypothetical protein